MYNKLLMILLVVIAISGCASNDVSIYESELESEYPVIFADNGQEPSALQKIQWKNPTFEDSTRINKDLTNIAEPEKATDVLDLLK